jgi:alkanesulfonate monooxygenase SsuD/methylene tetrahydromethanopterin reductase-like flavin-dependent oxidoreductase (luciferase family)
MSVDHLPDDTAVLKAALIETRAKLSGAEALIEHLQLVIAKMKREMFGPRSERSQRLIDQLELQLEELAAAAGEDETKAETARVHVQGFTRRQATRRNRSSVPARCSPGANVLPVLRRQQALEDRRRHHRDARCGAAVMVRDRACAGEVQLPVLREDHAAARPLPCDRTRLHRAQPVRGTKCIPNTILMALHLAHRTKNIKIGCGFNITPMWHPLRLAEDFAMADILTRGRIVFGVGRGYHTREVETFGSPLRDQEANRALFEEQVEIIFKAFSNECFSHKGKYYTLPPAVPYRGYTLKELTLVPRPLNLPVECWQPIQGGSARALEFMARHGIQGMVGGGSADGGAMHKVVVDWQTAHAKFGKSIELGERLCFGYHFYMADSREQGMKEAASTLPEGSRTHFTGESSRRLNLCEVVSRGNKPQQF